VAKRISRRDILKSMAGLTGAALSSGLLAACAPVSTAPQEPTSQESGAEAGEAAPPGLEAADLSVWVWWPDPVASLQQMGESFMEANSSVKVSVESPTDYWTKLQTALAGGAGPDVYFMNNVNYWAWASKEVLLDLTSLVDGDVDMQDNLQNSWQGAVEFYNFKGKQFGLPYMYTTVVLYYNEDYIKEQGLTPVADIEDDFDWNQFRDYALKLTQREGDDVTLWGGMSTEGIETGWLNFVRANGGDFLNDDHTQCIIDQPPSTEAWQFLTGLRLEDNVSPSPEALQAEGTRSMFLTGKLALWPGGSWVMKTLNEQLTDFTYNIAILPMSPQTKNRGGTTNIVGLVINTATEAKEQSWALMTHLLSKESQDILARADVLAPVRNDSAELYYDPALGPANRGAAFKMQQWTTALPTHEKVTWGEMMQPTTEWQTEIFEGRVGVEEGVQNIAAEVNGLFEAAG
jgi:multiple sugar transport system substrate-binding protein